MKNKIKFIIISLIIISGFIPTIVFAGSFSNTSILTYYRDGYSWGWDNQLNNVIKESSSTGSSVYAVTAYSLKTSWTAPTVRLVNTNGTYRSNTALMSATSNVALNMYNNTAPKGEYTNILVVGSSSQQGADTVQISFSPN